MVEPVVVLDTDVDVDVDSGEPIVGDIPGNDSMSDPDQYLTELYGKAEEAGLDMDDVMRMSEDEVAAILAGKEEEETAGEEGTAKPNPTAETPAASEPVPQAPAPVNWEERYKGMTELKARQDAELNQLRGIAQQIVQLRPYIDSLNDPAFRMHIDSFFDPSSKNTGQQTAVEEYDPLDPASVDRLVASRINKAFQDREIQARQQAAAHQQQTIVGNFNNGLANTRARLIAEGNDPAEVDAAIAEFSQKVTRGDFVADALRLKRVDNMIAEAEARGRKAGEEDALKKFKGASSHPIRTAAAAGRSSSPPKKSAPSDLSEVSSSQEMAELLNTLEVGSPAWEKAMRTAQKHGWV